MDGVKIQRRPDTARALPRRKSPTVPFFWPEWLIRREIAAQIRQWLEEFGRGRILDLGCGERPFEVYRPIAATDWIGFDVPENPKADVHGYAEKLPFAESSFETVICTDVLEHVEEPEALLREARRVLKPSGHLILATPLYWPLHEEPYDFFRFTHYGLDHLLKKAGLDMIRTQPLAEGFKMIALAVNTCFNEFSKRLPGGQHIAVRAFFVPVYILTNLSCLTLSWLFRAPNNAVEIAVVARKTD